MGPYKREIGVGRGDVTVEAEVGVIPLKKKKKKKKKRGGGGGI